MGKRQIVEPLNMDFEDVVERVAKHTPERYEGEVEPVLNDGGRPPNMIEAIPATAEELGDMVMQTLPMEQWSKKPVDKPKQDE